jgi:hypothetical protein
VKMLWGDDGCIPDMVRAWLNEGFDQNYGLKL